MRIFIVSNLGTVVVIGIPLFMLMMIRYMHHIFMLVLDESVIMPMSMLILKLRVMFVNPIIPLLKSVCQSQVLLAPMVTFRVAPIPELLGGRGH